MWCVHHLTHTTGGYDFPAGDRTHVFLGFFSSFFSPPRLLRLHFLFSSVTTTAMDLADTHRHSVEEWNTARECEPNTCNSPQSRHSGQHLSQFIYFQLLSVVRPSRRTCHRNMLILFIPPQIFSEQSFVTKQYYRGNTQSVLTSNLLIMQWHRVDWITPTEM